MKRVSLREHDPTGHAHYIDLEVALRIAAEGRAHDEPCEIVVFGAMQTNEMIARIVESEIEARIMIIARQMREEKHVQIAETFDAIWRLIHSSFSDPEFAESVESFDFESPFAPGTSDAEIFDKACGIFAVAGESATIFEEGITRALANALGKRAVRMRNAQEVFAREDGSEIMQIIFPVRISRGPALTDSAREMSLRGAKKTLLSISPVHTYDAQVRYTLV
jgi:hypothetical protein